MNLEQERIKTLSDPGLKPLKSKNPKKIKRTTTRSS